MGSSERSAWHLGQFPPEALGQLQRTSARVKEQEGQTSDSEARGLSVGSLSPQQDSTLRIDQQAQGECQTPRQLNLLAERDHDLS